MIDVVMAVDVGSASARAGLFAPDGNLIAWHVVPIRQWRPKAGYVEQSSTDIWSAVVTAVRGALKAAGPGHEVRGIAFDATCSLVVVDAGGAPVTVSPTGIDEQNIMMWMKNTYIPLDMIFISPKGVVTHIHENAEPMSEVIIPSDGPALGVLEVNAGYARKIGLKPGDLVRNPMFAH